MYIRHKLGGGPGWGQEQSLRGFCTPQQRSHALLPFLCPQKKLQDQRQDIVAEFEQSHQFLRERERHLLDQLTKLEQELTEGREKYKTKGVSELARLALLISELEGKAQQPAAELMQVSNLPRVGAGGQGAGSLPHRSPAGPGTLTTRSLPHRSPAGPGDTHPLGLCPTAHLQDLGHSPLGLCPTAHLGDLGTHIH